MVDFTTDKIQMNSPGLTYATPKAMPGKFSKLGGALDVIDKGVKAAVVLDQMNVVKTAEERAKDLSDAYMSQSPSEINYWSQAKQTAVEGLAQEPDNPVWQDMLNESNRKLELGFEQGQISAYEFQKRTQIEAEKILSNNPAYADEILASMQKVYERTGLMDTLKIDTDLLKNQGDAQAKELEGKVKFLETNGFPMRGKDPEDINLKYAEVGNQMGKVSTFEMNTQYLNAATEEDRAELRTDILKSPGGAFGMVNTSLQMYQTEIEKIASSSVSNDEKRAALDSLRILKKNSLGAMVDLLGPDKYTNLYNDNIKSIDSLYERGINLINGTDTVEDLKNSVETDQFTNELKIRQTLDPEMQEYQRKQVEILEKMLKVNPDFKQDQSELIGIMSSWVNQITKTDVNGETGTRLDFNDPTFGELFNMQFLKEAPATSRVAKESLEKTGKIPSITKGHLNNIWNVTAKMSTAPGRMAASDELIRTVNIIDPAVNEWMLKNAPDYAMAYVEEQNNYKVTIKKDIIAARTKDSSLPELSLNPNLGTVTTSNPAYRSAQQRINSYIAYKARGMGVKPSEIFEQTLQEDFPRLMYQTVTSQEEYDALSPNTIYVDDEGIAKRKK
tara:strand:- start:633 stop:2480 length:1848 start_codon:yes stop_codon:yes gene_type:complete